MSDPPEIDRDLGRLLFLMFPPSVRDSLAESAEFRQSFGLTLDAVIRFENSGISLKRSVLYRTVRRLYKEGGSLEARTQDAKVVSFTLEKERVPPALRIDLEGKSHLVPAFTFFSPDAPFRLAGFEEELDGKNVSEQIKEKWRSRLRDGPLTDDDVDRLREAMRLNAQDVAGAVAEEVKNDVADLRVLVPRDRRYYEGLVGPPPQASTIEAYLADTAPGQIQSLLDWEFGGGLAQCLLFCAHPSLSSLIDISGREPKDVEDFYEWLADHGDRYSQIAGFEVGIRALEHYPGIEPKLTKIATTLRDEDCTDNRGQLSLSACLMIFVDGELSRVGALLGTPPFYRRMAAIAQAGLIERELIAAGVSVDESALWALNGRGEAFYMQSYVDLRMEPRWLPDLMTGRQLRNEFISRINIAAAAIADDLPNGLKELLLGDGPDSLRNQLRVPVSYLPGPLEAGSVAPLVLPEHILEELRLTPEGSVLSPSLFVGVTSLGLVFKIEPEIAKLISGRLRTANYRLSVGSQDTGVSYVLLVGLASVAAVTRDTDLADEVRILARVMRRRGDVPDEPDSQMRIALIACASRTDLTSWCAAVGDWVLELAHGEISPEMATILRRQLRAVCHLVPQLWRYSAKADAALAAASNGA